MSKLVVLTMDDHALPETDRLSLFTADCNHYVVLTTGQAGKAKVVIERASTHAMQGKHSRHAA